MLIFVFVMTIIFYIAIGVLYAMVSNTYDTIDLKTIFSLILLWPAFMIILIAVLIYERSINNEQKRSNTN